MSQIPDIGPMMIAAPKSAPNKPARKPTKPPFKEMTDGELADEHRGCTLGKLRYKNMLAAIEAELTARKLTSAKGKLGFVSLQIADVGLVDIKRLRADLGADILRDYEIPGTNPFWLSGTLDSQDRPVLNGVQP